MKFEFIQFGFFGSYLFNAIFVFPDFSQKQLGDAKDLNDDEKIAVGTMVLIHVFQLVVVYIIV